MDSNSIQVVLESSLKYIHSPIEDWLGVDQDVCSRLLINGAQLRQELILLDGEIPIYEYLGKDSYSLITSKRVFSLMDSKWSELDLAMIISARKHISHIPHIPFEEQDPIKIIRVVDKNNNFLLLEFDSGIPAYFGAILILNLASFINKRKVIY